MGKALQEAGPLGLRGRSVAAAGCALRDAQARPALVQEKDDGSKAFDLEQDSISWTSTRWSTARTEGDRV